MEFYLVTEFLSAGKTTFLRGFLRILAPKRTLLIINEFGREGVDGLRNAEGNVLGSYLHGLFDNGHLWRAVVDRVCAGKGRSAGTGPTSCLRAIPGPV